LIVAPFWKKHGQTETPVALISAQEKPGSADIGWRRLLFVSLLMFSLTIPSDWTQDIPVRYSKRHPALHHSALYPAISNVFQQDLDFF